MATAPQFNTGYDEPAEPRPRRPMWVTCLIGCLGVVILVVVLLALATFWAWRNFRDVVATATSQVIHQAVEASELAAQEKQEVIEQVDRVSTAYRDGRLTNQQLGRILDRLAQSPLLSAFIIAGIEKKYFDNSGLSADEKGAGHKTLQRFVRGAIDGKIDEQARATVFVHIADKNPDGSWDMRSRVNDDELRAALAEAKSRADEAGVPDEPPAFDPSDEVKKLVDEALGNAAAAESDK